MTKIFVSTALLSLAALMPTCCGSPIPDPSSSAIVVVLPNPRPRRTLVAAAKTVDAAVGEFFRPRDVSLESEAGLETEDEMAMRNLHSVPLEYPSGGQQRTGDSIDLGENRNGDLVQVATGTAADGGDYRYEYSPAAVEGGGAERSVHGHSHHSKSRHCDDGHTHRSRREDEEEVNCDDVAAARGQADDASRNNHTHLP